MKYAVLIVLALCLTIKAEDIAWNQFSDAGCSTPSGYIKYAMGADTICNPVSDSMSLGFSFDGTNVAMSTYSSADCSGTASASLDYASGVCQG